MFLDMIPCNKRPAHAKTLQHVNGCEKLLKDVMLSNPSSRKNGKYKTDALNPKPQTLNPKP